jgi:hypothetical protein
MLRTKLIELSKLNAVWSVAYICGMIKNVIAIKKTYEM